MNRDPIPSFSRPALDRFSPPTLRDEPANVDTGPVIYDRRDIESLVADMLPTDTQTADFRLMLDSLLEQAEARGALRASVRRFMAPRQIEQALNDAGVPDTGDYERDMAIARAALKAAGVAA